jgi:hypothetical protein
MSQVMRRPMAGGDDAELGHELSEVVGVKGLCPVGERVIGVVVDFDEEAVGASGHGRRGPWEELSRRPVPWEGLEASMGR